MRMTPLRQRLAAEAQLLPQTWEVRRLPGHDGAPRFALAIGGECVTPPCGNVVEAINTAWCLLAATGH